MNKAYLVYEESYYEQEFGAIDSNNIPVAVLSTAELAEEYIKKHSKPEKFNGVSGDGAMDYLELPFIDKTEKEKLVFVHLSSLPSVSHVKQKEFVENIDKNSNITEDGSLVYVDNWIHMFKNVLSLNKSGLSGLEGLAINELEVDASVLLSGEDTAYIFDTLRAGLMKTRKV